MPSQSMARGVCTVAAPSLKATRSLYRNSRLGLDPCAITAVRNLRCGAVRPRTKNRKLIGMSHLGERGRVIQCARFQYDYRQKLEYAAAGYCSRDDGCGWRGYPCRHADVRPARQVD